MKMTRKAHRFLHVQNLLFYILFAVVIALLAFFSRQFVYQADWTYGQRNSLSERAPAICWKPWAAPEIYLPMCRTIQPCRTAASAGGQISAYSC
ncbi:MAG: hypothetical protein R3E89_04060 [Thiolinea sp.]